MRYLFAIAFATKDGIFIVNDYKQEYVDMLRRRNIKYCEIDQKIYEFIYDCMIGNGIDQQDRYVTIDGVCFERNLVGFK